MERTERTVSELSSLFRMVQTIPEAGSITRVYQMFLAFCTTWQTIGVGRAFLLLVDPAEGSIRGQIAAQRPFENDPFESFDEPSFENLAKRVFDASEEMECSDLTLRARSFAVPLDRDQSALVQAARGAHPVLADGGAPEFDGDPFFSYFDSTRYIAVPVRIGGRVLAVVAADNEPDDTEISVEDVSLVCSLAHHAGLAIERLLDDAEVRRTFRVLRKVQDVLRNAANETQLSEGLNLVLSMICRSVGGSGILLKDFVRHRTLHIKTIDEFALEADAADLTTGENLDAVLDRCAGEMRVVKGDGKHPLLGASGTGNIRAFYGCPLVSAGDGLGALVVYIAASDDDADEEGRRVFDARSRTFIDLCAGVLASRFDTLHRARRLERAEDMLEEIRSNLTREQDASRAGSRATEFYDGLRGVIGRLCKTIDSNASDARRIESVTTILAEAREELQDQDVQLEKLRSSLEMVNLYELSRNLLSAWQPGVENNGVEVTVRIPDGRASLLVNRENVARALSSVLRVVGDNVIKGDRVLVECSASDERVVFLVADTGAGMPGDLLSRLLMPFAAAGEDEGRNAMSVAGDVLRRHAGEITVRSSPSWRTILTISFPRASNRDRRRSRKERRKRSDRRRPARRRPG